MSKLVVQQPYSGETLAELDLQSAQDVENALETASQLKSKVLPAHRRIEILQKLSLLMSQEQEDLAILIANEGGKPLKDARVEVLRAIDGINIAIGGIRNIKGEEIPMGLTPASDNRLAFTTCEPIGVVVAISAFNHPLNLAIHQVIPAIATGCPAIIKPAMVTPLSAMRFVELTKQAGLPDGYLQVILADNQNSEKLVTDKRVSFFSFIGSAKIGWMLKGKLAAGARCALEHGGVAPVILDKYSETDRFISGLAKAGFYHSGQVCVSAQRVFVPTEDVENICQKLTSVAKSLVVGNAIDEKTDLGPIISNNELNRINQWVDEAIDEGATLITGGKKINDTCFEPTVLLNPSRASKVSQQEIFGPVICIYNYDDLDAAIEIANSLDVAFQASIFSDDIKTAINSAKKLDASAVMINDYTTFRVDWMPFAGRKQSGYGIGGIEQTMHDMLEHKMLLINHA